MDRPVAIELTAGAPPEARWSGPEGAGGSLALRQDPDHPGRWTARLTPRSPGWHRLTADAGEFEAESWLYAQPPEAWATLARERRQTATGRAELLGAGTTAPAGSPPVEIAGRTRLLLWLLAVGALGALWALSEPPRGVSAALGETGLDEQLPQ